jgi:hypothetical protein
MVITLLAENFLHDISELKKNQWINRKSVSWGETHYKKWKNFWQ